MSNPLVTVVIPCFNAAPFLKASIESVLKQTYNQLEVIVVDDGSHDASAEIACTFDSVQLLQQSHAGVAAARNTGVRHAKGSYIAFHDADDLCESTRIERQLTLLLRYPALSYVLSRIQNFCDKNSPPVVPVAHETLQPRMGFVSAMLARSNLLLSAPFNERLLIGEDIEWLMRHHQDCHASIPEVLIQRRLHAQNLTADLALTRKTLFEVLRMQVKKERNDI